MCDHCWHWLVATTLRPIDHILAVCCKCKTFARGQEPAPSATTKPPEPEEEDFRLRTLELAIDSLRGQPVSPNTIIEHAKVFKNFMECERELRATTIPEPEEREE